LYEKRHFGVQKNIGGLLLTLNGTKPQFEFMCYQFSISHRSVITIDASHRETHLIS